MTIDNSTQPDRGKGELILLPERRQQVVRRSEHFPLLPPGGPKADAKTINLPELWRLLRRHGLVWTCFVIAGALAGVLVTVLQTPVYRAHTSLEILSPNEDFLNTKQVSPIISGENNFETSDLQTQTKILQGETLSRRVIRKLSLSVPSVATAAPRSGAPSKPAGLFSKAPSSNPRKTALTDAAKTLKVRTSGRTRILELTIDSPDPQLAADFANSLSQEFIEQNTEARWNATQRTSEWLSRELDETRVKLERSENALQSYARDSGLVYTDGNGNISEEKLRQLQQELSNVSFDRVTKQSRFELAQSSSPDSLPEVLSDAGLRRTQEKLSDLRRELAEVNETYTPEYRKVKLIEAQISSLQATFDRDRAAILGRIRNEYLESLRKEKLLTASYEAQTRRVGGENEKSIQYKILKREVDSNRQLYETMTQQLKSSSIASAMRASSVRVIDAADTPATPSSPNPKLNCALGLFSGLLLGGVFLITRDGADRTLQDPGDAQFWMNTTELGFVPSAAMNLEKNLPTRIAGVYSGFPEASGLGTAAGRRTGRELELFGKDRMKAILIADATRAVLTSIMLGEEGEQPRVLVVTSPGTSEGKTTLTCNLGIALAEIRRRVLIVDADLRKPRMHKLFDLPNDTGLSTFLANDGAPNEQTLDELIHHTKVPGLDILPSGPSGYRVTHLLYSSQVNELLKLLRKNYDMVLIDTPPMLRISDARVLARMADAAILVTRARKTSREAASAANSRLTEDGTRVLGTVLNDWDPTSSFSSYSKEYLRSYHRA